MRYPVLIVDEDSDIRDSIGDCLGTLGHESFCVADGRAAREELSSIRIGLIITAFCTGQVNGAGLLSWCRKRDLHFPFIFTSARFTPAGEKVALSDCCTALLRKPFGCAALLDAVASAGRRVHSEHCPRL